MRGLRGVMSVLIMSYAMLYASDNPVDIVRDKDRELQKAIGTYRTTPSTDNKEIIITLINGIFDFSTMGQKVLPKAVWDSASGEDRKNFIYQFRRMVENGSFSKLEMYQSDSVFYSNSEIVSGKTDLSARVWYKGHETKLLYKMQKKEGQWKVWDLIIGDMSTVRTYKEQFAEILKTKSLAELTDLLKKKADSYSVKKNEIDKTSK